MTLFAALANQMDEPQMQSRRDFLKKAGYVAPAVVTLSAVPAFAGSGSGYTSDGHRNQRGNGHREHGNGKGKGHHKD